MRFSDENLRGRTVIGADGQTIGEIAALFLNSDAWRVESLQIKLRKEVADQLGAPRGMFHAGTLELPVRMVQSVGTPLSSQSLPSNCGRFCLAWSSLQPPPNLMAGSLRDRVQRRATMSRQQAALWIASQTR